MKKYNRGDSDWNPSITQQPYSDSPAIIQTKRPDSQQWRTIQSMDFIMTPDPWNPNYQSMPYTWNGSPLGDRILSSPVTIWTSLGKEKVSHIISSVS